MPVPDPRAARRGAPVRWAAVALAALLLAGFAAAPAPVAAAARTMVPACNGVNLRTGASTSTATKARLATGTTVTVVGTVNGSSWSTVCAGSKSGSTWYRISHVKGKTVRSLYGVTYLYAAKGVLKTAPTASAPTPTPPPTTTQSATPDPYGAELMRLVNLDRAALGLPPFAVDAGLVAIARDAPFTCPTNPGLVLRGRAADMADRSYFGHTVAGCYLAGTTTPYPALDIVRTVFGYAQARSEILHWNSYGSAATAYELGCSISGGNCAGGTTTTPYTVALAQRSFMSSSPHRTSQLASYQRFGCGSASVPGTTKTYFACLFSNGGSSWSPAPAPSPSPSPAPAPDAAATPPPSPAPDPAVPPAAQAMVPACSGVNLRTGATTSAAVKATLGTSAALTVVATVAGSSWSTDCAGPKSGSTWYQVSHVNGQAVGALYGVAALYAATGVLAAAPAVVPAATVPGAVTGPTSLGASVTFYGRGWGHGVGLSQYGARGRALAGQDVATILAHYYPGTAIGLIAPDSAIRVLLLDDTVPTAAGPLAVIGRGGPWTIDGIGAVFPADARLRLVPATSGTATTWRMLVDDAARHRPRRCRQPRRPPGSGRGPRHHLPAAGPCGHVQHLPGNPARAPRRREGRRRERARHAGLPPGRRTGGDAVELAGGRPHGPDDRGPLVRGVPAPARRLHLRRLRRHPVAGVPRRPRRIPGGRRARRRHRGPGPGERHRDRQHALPLHRRRGDRAQRERLRLLHGGEGGGGGRLPPRVVRTGTRAGIPTTPRPPTRPGRRRPTRSPSSRRSSPPTPGRTWGPSRLSTCATGGSPGG